MHDNYAINNTIHSTGDINHMIQSKCYDRDSYKGQPLRQLITRPYNKRDIKIEL